MDYQNYGAYGVGISNHKKFINFKISQVDRLHFGVCNGKLIDRGKMIISFHCATKFKIHQTDKCFRESYRF